MDCIKWCCRDNISFPSKLFFSYLQNIKEHKNPQNFILYIYIFFFQDNKSSEIVLNYFFLQVDFFYTLNIKDCSNILKTSLMYFFICIYKLHNVPISLCFVFFFFLHMV
jgi:hypothetical protein